jgi:hypothetical protein
VRVETSVGSDANLLFKGLNTRALCNWCISSVGTAFGFCLWRDGRKCMQNSRSPLSRRDRATRLASCGFQGRSHHSLGSSQVPVCRMNVFASRQLSLEHEIILILFKFLHWVQPERRDGFKPQSFDPLRQDKTILFATRGWFCVLQCALTRACLQIHFHLEAAFPASLERALTLTQSPDNPHNHSNRQQ